MRHIMITHGFFPSLWPKYFRLKQASEEPLSPAEAEQVTFDSPECWGSAEEHEIQRLLQELVSSSLNSGTCLQVLQRIYGCLETSSDEWVDRFAEYQGTLVLKKLLSDINFSDKYMQLQDLSDYEPGNLEREFAIVKCLSVVVSRSSVARTLASQGGSQSVLHTLLRSALSPNEQTRQVASATLEQLKDLVDCSSSDVLQMLNVYRSPSSSVRVASRELCFTERSDASDDEVKDESLETKDDQDYGKSLALLPQSSMGEPFHLNLSEPQF